jgi:hypothetical protein
MDQPHYLLMMAAGYFFSISIETPILIALLSSRHPIKHKLFAGFWLTACTYPILWLVLPQLIDPNAHRDLYLAVGETFVPIAECLLFWLAFGRTEPRSRLATLQDMAVVVLANLASFGLGEVFNRYVGWDWLWRA